MYLSLYTVNPATCTLGITLSRMVVFYQSKTLERSIKCNREYLAKYMYMCTSNCSKVIGLYIRRTENESNDSDSLHGHPSYRRSGHKPSGWGTQTAVYRVIIRSTLDCKLNTVPVRNLLCVHTCITYRCMSELYTCTMLGGDWCYAIRKCKQANKLFHLFSFNHFIGS